MFVNKQAKNNKQNASTMKNRIGIRHEDKYVMERRVAITPNHVWRLVHEKQMEVCIESSAKRVFSDAEFDMAGAKIVNDVSDCPVIFGVKEMPLDLFQEDKTYVFFSHVIKGQSYNMPMLKRMMEKKASLIDYEKITDDSGRRQIFFGRFAGLAGMVNALWSLGQRLAVQGIESPFSKIRQAHTYNALADAKKVISQVGQEIIENGLPAALSPLVIGFTGYGNVSGGAQEIAQLLPIKEVSPQELLQLKNRPDVPANVLYKVVFKEEHLSRSVNPDREFDLADYYANPANYESQFEKYIPHLTILMNCMYWDDRYPRIVTKDYLARLYAYGEPQLKVIGDITCDPNGSIECTHKGTVIENPVFVYNPETRKPVNGFKGHGVLVMAVDILPSELPRESSVAFSNALFKYVKDIAITDYSLPFDLLPLPAPVKRALILHRGQLTPDYKYLEEAVNMSV